MKERLFSLDLLRGLDMFLLKAVGPLVMAADRVWHLPSVKKRHPLQTVS